MQTPEFKTFVLEDNGGEPVIARGSKLLCVKGIEVQDGDFVVIMRKNTFPLLRRYTLRTDGSVLLKSQNPDADSYAAAKKGFDSTTHFIVLRSEASYPAAGRLAVPESFQNGIPSGEKRLAEVIGMPEKDSELLTFEEAERLLKVRRTKMYALLRSGTLKASKLGKLWRIEKSAITEYLQSMKYEKGGVPSR